jgi:hypothetical protein
MLGAMLRAFLVLSLTLMGCGGRETCSAPVKSVGGAPPQVQPWAPPSASAR